MGREEADRYEQVHLLHQCPEVVPRVAVWRGGGGRGDITTAAIRAASRPLLVPASPFEPVDQVVVVLVGHEGQLPQEVGEDDVRVGSPELGILSTGRCVGHMGPELDGRGR